MDKTLMGIVGKHAVAREGERILNYVLGFYIGDYAELELIAHLRALFRQQRELLTTEEIASIRAAEETEREVSGMSI